MHEISIGFIVQSIATEILVISVPSPSFSVCVWREGSAPAPYFPTNGLLWEVIATYS